MNMDQDEDYDVVRILAVVTGIEWNLLGHAKIQCDSCGDQYETGRFKFLPPAARAELAAELRAAGWIVDGDHERHLCPSCAHVKKTLAQDMTALLRARNRK